mgnify:CR=1 FL=1
MKKILFLLLIITNTIASQTTSESFAFANDLYKNEKFETLHFVFGVVDDKDLVAILPMFPKNACYYFCKPNIPRGLNEKLLQEQCVQFGLSGDVYYSVEEAYKAALSKATDNDLVFVGGSTFVVAEVV